MYNLPIIAKEIKMKLDEAKEILKNNGYICETIRFSEEELSFIEKVKNEMISLYITLISNSEPEYKWRARSEMKQALEALDKSEDVKAYICDYYNRTDGYHDPEYIMECVLNYMRKHKLIIPGKKV